MIGYHLIDSWIYLLLNGTRIFLFLVISQKIIFIIIYIIRIRATNNFKLDFIQLYT